MLDFSRCAAGPDDRRRVFWATQPDACGTQEPCPGVSCGVAGHRYVDSKQCNHPGIGGCPPSCPSVVNGRSIDNSNWIRGLALNIVLTDGRLPDSDCGHLPGRRGGHWSESYANGARISSKIRQLPTNCAVAESVRQVEDALTDDLGQMVAWGVAREVKASARYAGNNTIEASAEIIGDGGETTVVGLSGTRLVNAWAWGTTT